MFLIIGLGNPGDEYEDTKHNIGREIVTRLAKKYDFPAFTHDKKANALVSVGKIEKEKVILALPETFMNKSGLAAAVLAKYYKVKPAAVFVVHDDIDLTIGRIKLSFAKSSAGHKGVDSIIKNFKTNEFYRVRVGISNARKTKQALEVVLKKFSAKEEPEIKKAAKHAVEALACAVAESPQKAMTEYNA